MKKFHNFEMVFEVKCDVNLNSGVQIRSSVLEKDGHLAGPQVEIEERTAGYIYGEALKNPDGSRRGWMSKDRSKTPNAFKPGEWNSYRIVVEGNHYRTWINGVPIADLKDESTNKAGLIGLQVHSVKKENQFGTQVRWRNIKIRELK